jgi:hypothetical protein
MRNTGNDQDRLIPAEVLPESGSRYNGRVMRIAKSTYSQLILVLALGLMYSQVCNVICAFSNCSAPATTRITETVEHGGHCHQKRQSSTKEKAPPAPEDKHTCPAHGSAVSILPSDTVSTVVSHYAWQIPVAELASSFDIPSDPAGNISDRGGHFRSPPRRPQFTILRI